MKYLVSILVMVGCLMVPSSLSATFPSAVKEVTVDLSEAYIPENFNAAMDAYIVVSGMFPDSCYSWLRADVKKTAKYVHEITAIAYKEEGRCYMVIIPFQKEVGLGRLPSGEHILRLANSDGTYFERVLVIK